MLDKIARRNHVILVMRKLIPATMKLGFVRCSSAGNEVRIVVEEWHAGVTLRAGVLERESMTQEGVVVLSTRGAGQERSLVQFDTESVPCNREELDDVEADALAASLQADLSSALVELKRLYCAGGARPRAVRC